MISEITRLDFTSTSLHPKKDKFALTFKAKADTLKLWPLVRGYVDEKDEVKSAICIRISKREPHVANLQLLHTFAQHRNKGLARELVLSEYWRVRKEGAEYFRVSSEFDAAGFYRSLGLKFWGEQKSGSLLCMHKIKTKWPKDGEYVFEDPVIQKALFSGRRGCIVKKYKEPW